MLNVVLFIVGIFSLFMMYHEITAPVDIPITGWFSWKFPNGGELWYDYLNNKMVAKNLEPYEAWDHPERWQKDPEDMRILIKKTKFFPLTFHVGTEWMNETYALNDDGTVEKIASECNW